MAPMNYWPALLLLVAVGLFLLEFVIPSAGILGVLAVSALLGALVSAFWIGGVKLGAIYTLGSAIALPILASWLIRWWPTTPIGRRVVMTPPDPDDVLPTNRLQAAQWIGRHGVTLGPLLPSGSVRIDDTTLDARSEGGSIETGTPVFVIGVRDNRLVVRAGTYREGELQASAGIDPSLPTMIPDPFDDSAP